MTRPEQLDLEDAIAAASPKVWGYARVSTDEQHASAQEPELRAAGAADIVLETGSGAGDLPALRSLVARLRPGDTLAVTEVSRLGRTTPGVLALADELRRRGVALRVTRLGVDTATPAGQLVLSMMAALAAYGRSQLLERQRAGVVAARIRGVRFGRPPAMTDAQIDHAADLIRAGATLSATAAMMGVGKTTLSRAIRRRHPALILPGSGIKRGVPKRRGHWFRDRRCFNRLKEGYMARSRYQDIVNNEQARRAMQRIDFPLEIFEVSGCWDELTRQFRDWLTDTDRKAIVRSSKAWSESERVVTAFIFAALWLDELSRKVCKDPLAGLSGLSTDSIQLVCACVSRDVPV
jgi:putative DNA-invertase from lambdoid prophage Rac